MGDPAAKFDEELVRPVLADPRASEKESRAEEDLANADAKDRVTRPGRIDTGVGMVMLVRVEVVGESGDWTCVGGCWMNGLGEDGVGVDKDAEGGFSDVL